MTERIPPPFGASRTLRPMHTRRALVLRLHDALREHGGFAARALSGPLSSRTAATPSHPTRRQPATGARHARRARLRRRHAAQSGGLIFATAGTPGQAAQRPRRITTFLL